MSYVARNRIAMLEELIFQLAVRAELNEKGEATIRLDERMAYDLLTSAARFAMEQQLQNKTGENIFWSMN